MTPFVVLSAFRPVRALFHVAALGAALGTFSGCNPDKEVEDGPKPSAGSADFSRYIAVGNSLTAGFEDNGLYREGQLNSYPLMLAGQFAKAGGGEFVQPLFTEAQANGTGYLKLTGFDAAGLPILASETYQLAVVGTSPRGPLLAKFTADINNLGVPGLRMAEIEAASLGNPAASSSLPFNNLFERLVPAGVTNQTYLQRVAAARPTFFTCWLGNNDVLGYATSGGGVADLQPASYGMTDTATFGRRARKLIDSLTVRGAKGVVGLIPNVTAIPFFNAVGPRVKADLQSRGITQMVITTKAFQFGATTRRTIDVSDIKSAAGGRQLFTLTATSYASLIGKTGGQGGGKYWLDLKAQLSSAGIDPIAAFNIDTTQAFGLTNANPWPSTLILDDAEQVDVQARTAAFNTIMRNKAAAEGLAVFDAYTFFDGIAATGIATSGVNNTTEYITGNLFSLDGVHPTPRGYAVIANELLRIINAKYGATLPAVDAGSYRGVKLP